MIEVSTVDKILHTVYLDAITANLNNKTSPFYKEVEKNCVNIVGKEVHVPIRYGINGGVGCAKEAADLPRSGTPSFILFKQGLVNIYGNVEITDKALRMQSEGISGAVSVLNQEIETLLASAKFNLRRMLFRDGTGVLTTVSTATTSSGTVIPVTDYKFLMEGMIVDLYSTSGPVETACRITYIDRVNSTMKLDKTIPAVSAGVRVVAQGGLDCELAGLGYLFNANGQQIYGNLRTTVNYYLPKVNTSSTVDFNALSNCIDDAEERSGAKPNMIFSSYEMKRRYVNSMNEAQLNIEVIDYDDENKVIGINGIPLFTEKFMPENKMYFVNTKDFILSQLGDWSWIEGTTKGILRPIVGKAAYAATIVKYCNLMCVGPIGQIELDYEE